MWAILVVTLPTQPNAVRLRIWRALKALGCAALRDGAYLLRAQQGRLFEPLAAEVREHGGSARVLRLSPLGDARRDELLALFDRGDAYAAWHGRIYLRFGDVPLVAGLFYGLKPAVTALVLQAAHRIGTRALRNRWMWGIAAASFVALRRPLRAEVPDQCCGGDDEREGRVEGDGEGKDAWCRWCQDETHAWPPQTA